MVRSNEYPCLRITHQGKIYHCREFGRFVIDFKGCYFVLRPWEFRCLQRRITRMLSCAWSRFQLEQGESIRLQNTLGSKTLTLAYPDVVELAELIKAASPIMEKTYLW
jgi:hypothetical protein